MKTSLDIPKDLIEEAIRVSKKKTKKEVVIIALNEFVKKMRLKEAIEMEGKLNFDDSFNKTRHER